MPLKYLFKKQKKKNVEVMTFLPFTLLKLKKHLDKRFFDSGHTMSDGSCRKPPYIISVTVKSVREGQTTDLVCSVLKTETVIITVF